LKTGPQKETGDRYSAVVVSSGLTVFRKKIYLIFYFYLFKLINFVLLI
jgi:hypothetical protein